MFLCSSGREGCISVKLGLYLHVRKSSETIPFEPEISRVDASHQLLGIKLHIFLFTVLSPSYDATSQIQPPETQTHCVPTHFSCNITERGSSPGCQKYLEVLLEDTILTSITH